MMKHVFLSLIFFALPLFPCKKQYHKKRITKAQLTIPVVLRDKTLHLPPTSFLPLMKHSAYVRAALGFKVIQRQKNTRRLSGPLAILQFDDTRKKVALPQLSTANFKRARHYAQLLTSETQGDIEHYLATLMQQLPLARFEKVLQDFDFLLMRNEPIQKFFNGQGRVPLAQKVYKRLLAPHNVSLFLKKIGYYPHESAQQLIGLAHLPHPTLLTLCKKKLLSLPQPQMLRSHDGWVYDCDFNSDGTRLVSAYKNHSLRVWDTHTGKAVRRFPGKPFLQSGHNDWVQACTFFADNQHVLSASHDGTLKKWHIGTKRCQTFTENTPTRKLWIKSCAIHPQNPNIVAATFSQMGKWTVKLWDLSKGQPIRSMAGHRAMVKSCRFNHDGTRLISASADGTARIFCNRFGERINELTRAHGFC